MIIHHLHLYPRKKLSQCYHFVFPEMAKSLHCAPLYSLTTGTVQIILLVASFHISPEMACFMEELCEMTNTRGETPKFTEIAWDLLGTMTCYGHCMQMPRCFATTSDPSSKSCVIHEAEGDEWPCVKFTNRVGPVFSIKLPPGRLCPTVSQGLWLCLSSLWQ